MALLWIEGFEGFGDTIDGAPEPTGIIGRKYPSIVGESSMDINEGRGGDGFCLEIEDITDYIHSRTLTTDLTTVLGCAVYIPTFHVSLTRTILSLYDGAQLGMNIKVKPDGRLQVYKGVTSVGTTIDIIFPARWYYIEFKVYLHDSAGTVDLYINSVNVLSLSGIDTLQGTVTAHNAFRLSPPSFYTLFDDLYFLDGTGSINNDVLGPRKVVAINPDGAGDDSDWTPSAGSNYQNADDGALLDEDTTYNETSTDAHQDLFTYENLPATVVTVDGLQITTDARITAGDMDLSTVVKTGTTTDVGSPTNIISTDYVTTVRIDEVDPDTAIAWIPSGVDGAQFGVLANT